MHTQYSPYKDLNGILRRGPTLDEATLDVVKRHIINLLHATSGLHESHFMDFQSCMQACDIPCEHVQKLVKKLDPAGREMRFANKLQRRVQCQRPKLYVEPRWV